MRTCVHHGEAYGPSPLHYLCMGPEKRVNCACSQPLDDDHPPCFVPLPPAPKKILVTPCPGCGGSRAIYRLEQRADADAWRTPLLLLACPWCTAENGEVPLLVPAEETDSSLLYGRGEPAADPE